MTACGIVDQIPQIDEVVLEDVDRAQPVQRPHRVIGVANPAVAVVPVAPALLELRHRGRHGGDNGAGFFIGAQLQRDRRADHRLLIVERQIEFAHPVLPIGDRSIQRALNAVADILVVALVRTKEEGVRPLQPEHALLQHMRHGTIGRQAEGDVGAHIADMVGSGGVRRRARPPVCRGPQPHTDAWCARQRPHDARKGQRPIGARVFRVTRGEVDDLGGRSVLGRHDRAQNRRVADIGLIDRFHILHLDDPEAMLGLHAIH